MVQLFIFHVLNWLAHVEYFKSVNNYDTYSFQALLVSCLGFHCWKNYYCEVDIYHVQIHFFVINIENSLIHSQSWKIFIINVIAMIKMLLFCYSHLFSAVLPHPPWIFILFVELKSKKKSVIHFWVHVLESNLKGKLCAALNSLEAGNCNKNWLLDHKIIVLICYLGMSHLYPTGNSGINAFTADVSFMQLTLRPNIVLMSFSSLDSWCL